MYTFLTMIVPALSQGSLHVENQSLPAYIARLMTPETNFTDYTKELGLYRFLSIPMALIGLCFAIWVARRHADHPLFVSILLLTALLTGPLTWGHYASWACVAIIPMLDRNLWEWRSVREQRHLSTALFMGFLLIGLPIYAVTPVGIAMFGWLRFLTGVRTIGLLIWLCVAISLGIRSRAPLMCADSPHGT